MKRCSGNPKLIPQLMSQHQINYFNTNLLYQLIRLLFFQGYSIIVGPGETKLMGFSIKSIKTEHC